MDSDIFIEVLFHGFLYFINVSKAVRFSSSCQKILFRDINFTTHSGSFISARRVKNTEMRAIQTNVFGGQIVRLAEINDTTILMSATDKIFNQRFLVPFTNKVIKDDNFLVIIIEFIQRGNFIITGFNHLITSFLRNS